MYTVDFSRPCRIYFVGIGGISMSAIAEVLRERGFTVLGSDRAESEVTKRLEEKGVRIFYGQKRENITPDIDCVVFTAAIHPDNPEYARTLELGIPHMTRAEILGQLMKNYEMPVAVSGTHGKTTTTSMLSELLVKAGTDPTLFVGGMLPSIGGNIRVWHSGYFVTEACEYTNSFLSFFPRIGIILNVEEDHMDFFHDLAEIRDSFARFAGLLPEDGALIINASIPDYRELTKDLPCKVILFGPDPVDAYGEEVLYCPERIPLKLLVPGHHNELNAMAALAAAEYMGIRREQAVAALEEFTGTERRFERKGTFGDGVQLVDDYAHHPTEIEATLRAALSVPHRELWVAFQSHTYTRTKAFLEEFAEALSLADHVVVAPIYAARETDTLGVGPEDIAVRIRERGKDAVSVPDFASAEEYLWTNCIKDDLCITMGAGDVYKIGEALLGRT